MLKIPVPCLDKEPFKPVNMPLKFVEAAVPNVRFLSPNNTVAGAKILTAVRLPIVLESPSIPVISKEAFANRGSMVTPPVVESAPCPTKDKVAVFVENPMKVPPVKVLTPLNMSGPDTCKLPAPWMVPSKSPPVPLTLKVAPLPIFTKDSVDPLRPSMSLLNVCVSKVEEPCKMKLEPEEKEVELPARIVTPEASVVVPLYPLPPFRNKMDPGSPITYSEAVVAKAFPRFPLSVKL